jgi:hypothetical protein
MKFLLIPLILMSGCGVDVNIDDVEVKHRLDVENIEKYARIICQKELPPEATELEFQGCLDLKIAELYQLLVDL